MHLSAAKAATSRRREPDTTRGLLSIIVAVMIIVDALQY
jgi:hypothetical protein